MIDEGDRNRGGTTPYRRLWSRRIAIALFAVCMSVLLTVSLYIQAGKALGEALIDLGHLDNLVGICGVDAGFRTWWRVRPMGPYCDYEECEERLRRLCPEQPRRDGR